MILAVCARNEHGVSRDDRERAVEQAVSRALRYAKWAFPARELPPPIIRRFDTTALISWGNEPSTWSIAGAAKDNRSVVDGVGYLAPGYSSSVAAQTRDLLDYSTSLGGCFNLFRATDERIEAVTDATKSNSVYVSESDRLWVLSSRALLGHMVASERNRPEFDLRSLATMPGRGYILGNGSPYKGTSLLGIAEHVVMTPERQIRSTAVPDAAEPEGSIDPADWKSVVDETAEALVRAFDPLDGEELHLALTGGRDSRVIAAALSHHEGIRVSAHTMGVPSEPDVILAAEVATICGWTHEVTAPSRTADSGSSLLVEDPIDRITRVLDVHDAMNSAWDDIQDYGPVNSKPIMSGVGGEILRGGLVLTSHSELSSELVKRELTAALGSSPLIASAYATPYGRQYLEMAETAPFRASDEFYYHERNGRWVASRRMGARFRRRVVDPLLDNRFIRATRQIDPGIRWSERLAFDVICRLNPDLRDLRLEGNRWRFERVRPHPASVAGWKSRAALVRDPRAASFHWKNLEDAAVRRRIDEIILDALESGPASELLDRGQVERFLSAGSVRASQRWNLATTSVLLSDRWWLTERDEIREPITIKVPAGMPESITGDDRQWDAEPQAAPAISVIIPMHNAERHIRETLMSVAAQSMMDFEVIVVDDGSTDRSADIVDTFIERDNRFTRLEGPAVGSAGAARNAGLAKARGQYLAFLDADDLFAPSMLEKLYSKAIKDSADVILTGFRSFDDVTGEEKSQKWAFRVEYLPTETPFSPSDIVDHIFYITNPANWNKLYRRQFILDNAIQFQHLARSNDAYFTFLSLAKASRISYVNEELVKYRVGNASSLQGSIHETPLEFVEALSKIDESLRASGIEDKFKRAFLNLVSTMSMGALLRAKTANSFVLTYEEVRNRLFPKYGLTDADGTIFLSEYIQRNIAEIVDKPVTTWLFERNTTRPKQSDTASEEVGLGVSDGPVTTRATHKMRPDVSVIIPVFNAARWLHECLLSVLGQSDVSLEVICVNDGSTDESLRILNEYASSDARIVILNVPNGGQSAARNMGLDVASGRYTIFLDSDDSWRSDGLSKLVSHADRDALDLLLFDAESFFEPGVTEKDFHAYATYYERQQSYSTPVTGAELISALRQAREYRASPCLYLTRTDLLARTGLRFIPGIVHEDNPFTFALLLNASRVAHEKFAFYGRRVRPGSTMTAGSAERSMRGYFVSYLDMYRQLSRHSIPEKWSEDIGRLVHQIYFSARRHFVELPSEVGDKLRDIDRSPDAYCAFLMLHRDRGQVTQLRQLTN